MYSSSSVNSALSDKEKKKLQEKNEKILQDLLKEPGNKTCADCGSKGPRWASWNIGIFLCIRCGGLHRKLGTHISKVKSINLDSWTPEQIASIKANGNTKVNAIYIPHPARHPPPMDSDTGMEKYIRDKYEKKLFMEQDSGRRIDEEEERSSTREQPEFEEIRLREKYRSELKKLYDMGFTKEIDNIHALRRANGEVSVSIEFLVAMSAHHEKADEGIVQLRNMGFNDEEKAKIALRKANGNINDAANILISEASTSPQVKVQVQMPSANLKTQGNSSTLKTSSLLDEPPKTPQTQDAFSTFGVADSFQPRTSSEAYPLAFSDTPGMASISLPTDPWAFFSDPTQNGTSTNIPYTDDLQPFTETKQNKASKQDILSLFQQPTQQPMMMGGTPAYPPNVFDNYSNMPSTGYAAQPVYSSYNPYGYTQSATNMTYGPPQPPGQYYQIPQVQTQQAYIMQPPNPFYGKPSSTTPTSAVLPGMFPNSNMPISNQPTAINNGPISSVMPQTNAFSSLDPLQQQRRQQPVNQFVSMTSPPKPAPNASVGINPFAGSNDNQPSSESNTANAPANPFNTSNAWR